MIGLAYERMWYGAGEKNRDDIFDVSSCVSKKRLNVNVVKGLLLRLSREKMRLRLRYGDMVKS